MILDVENEKIREFMRYSIDAGKKCIPEDEEHKPKVGAVIVKNGQLLGMSYRGELDKGNHAEFTLLEKKLKDLDLTGATLYTTLEPCTSRKSKTPCAEWIVKRGITKVYIGMFDPNPLIFGKGFELLKNSGIEVLNYPPELTKEIENDNSHFITYCKLLNSQKIQSLEDLPYHISPHYRSLDDWYFIINRIYFDKNFSKDANQIFSHLVEILGGLSILHTHKNKEINPEEQIAKALAWWLVLCGKVGIRSVEDMIYYKFPDVCPYCEKNPHIDDLCLKIKLTNSTPNWNNLLIKGKSNPNKRPSTLASWQQMFYSIYPISQNEDYDKALGRFTEEIGELSESLRVFQIAPTYFLSEASDVFAWLMHISNLYERRKSPHLSVEERGKYLENILFDIYPDKCKDCDQLICSCPPVLKSTIGRISNDGPDLSFFENNNNPFMSKGEVSTQFDFGSKSILILFTQFTVNSKLTKLIYNFSNELIKEIRHSKTLQNSKSDKIVDALHHIISFATTQRVTQRSVDRFLRCLIDFDVDERKELIFLIKRVTKSEWSESIITYVEGYK